MNRWLSGIAALLLVLLAASPAAHADFGLVPGSFQVTTSNAAGQPELRAGAHPDLLDTGFAFDTLPGGGADGNVKDVVIDLPAGLVGALGAVPTCARTALNVGACSADSQIGVMKATFAGLDPTEFALYNVAPREGEFAELGFFALLFPVRFVVELREDSDYSTRIELRDLSQNVPLIAGQVELWGVPADHQSGPTPPRRPFLTSPTSCTGGPRTTTLHVRSWQQPDHWIDATSTAAGPLTGCGALAFDPTLDVGLDTPTADTTSGMSVTLTLPQNDDPDGLASSQAHGLAMTLPAGLTLSPGVANGLTACDDDQIGIGTARTPACPESSKIGTVELTTPLLPEPLDGAIYFARPLPSDKYRLFLTARGQGVTLKLDGSLQPDPETGQLSVSLTGLPAVPVSRLRLHFKDGPRAPLATPPRCGPGAATADVTPYRGGPPANVAALIEIVAGPGGTSCPVATPFAPLFVAGSSPATGGGDSAFSMTVRRADGEQTLDRLSMTLPSGLTARLASVVRCPAVQAARAECSAASRLGAVGVEVGAGASPLPLTGDAYLTGPRRGAPFGLALVLHAHAGPLDFGTIVVLGTLRLDPANARLTVATDSLPKTAAGVPLRLRTLTLDIRRHGFMRNPTSCSPMHITAALTSIDEAASHSSVRYALGRCRTLEFAPAVSMSLGPKSKLRPGGRPELTIQLRSGSGQAAVRTARIELPRAVELDASAVTQICTQARARDGRCPRGSAVGSARVRTPLLPRTLSGTVNVVQPVKGSRPELWASVAGMGVHLRLRSITSAPRGTPISSSFVDLPDMPLSALTLRLGGGRHGLLRLASGLCTHGRPRPIVVAAALRGRNGALREARVLVHGHPACRS